MAWPNRVWRARFVQLIADDGASFSGCAERRGRFTQDVAIDRVPDLPCHGTAIPLMRTVDLTAGIGVADDDAAEDAAAKR